VTATSGAKRRQEEERGMRISPEKFIIEGADGFARIRGPHCHVKRLSMASLPGTQAQIETSGKHAEQERPMVNHRQVGREPRETIEEAPGKGIMGVGPAHGSEEMPEVRPGGRRRGAKGGAEQGTWSKDR